MQYLSQLKAKVEGRGISLVSDTGMGSIMKAVLVGCVEVENPDCASKIVCRVLVALKTTFLTTDRNCNPTFLHSLVPKQNTVRCHTHSMKLSG